MNSLERIDNEFTEPLMDHGYTLRRGWDKSIAKELVELSQQEHIRKFTPKDRSKRFTDEAAAETWFNKTDRVVYTLANTAVAGLIWFGKSHSVHTSGDYTFAIRIYEETRGQKLARPFMEAAHEDFRKYTAYNGAIWLETDIDNTHAVALYEKTGYKKVDTVNGRFVMTHTPPDHTA